MSIKEWAVQLGALENVSHTIVQNGTVIQRCREKLERRGRENAMREALRKVIAASTDNRSCVRQLRSILNELERLAPRVGKEMELMRLRKAISSLLVQVEQSQTIAADVQERGDLYELNDVPMGLPKRHNENPWRNQSVDARPKWHANHSVEGNVDGATGERIPLLGTKFHATSQDQKCRMDEERRQKEEEYALSLIRERTNSLQEIQSSIEDVHEIMKDIQKMALEQGEKLEDVSINMAKASDHMNQGANELSKTEDAARSSRRRLIACWFCTLLLLATIFITERYW